MFIRRWLLPPLLPPLLLLLLLLYGLLPVLPQLLKVLSVRRTVGCEPWTHPACQRGQLGVRLLLILILATLLLF